MANLPAIIEDTNVGFEDFEVGDMVMPTLRIDHQEGVLVDNLSGEQFTEITVILLGLVKQRILWPVEMSETKEQPLCRSLDFAVGTPQPDRFPWKASGLEKKDHLSCDSCPLKEWGSNPKNESPWCSEQWTFPLMMPAGNGWAPALLTLQRSNLKAARAYMTSFARSKSPLFTCESKVTLQQNKRGTVKYVNLFFAKGQDTPEEQRPEYAENYRRIREWVQTPRDESTATEEEETTATGKTSEAALDESEIDF